MPPAPIASAASRASVLTDGPAPTAPLTSTTAPAPLVLTAPRVSTGLGASTAAAHQEKQVRDWLRIS